MTHNNAIRAACAILTVGLAALPSGVMAGSVAGTGGASEVTQILNNSELMVQTSQSYEQLQRVISQTQMAQRQLDNLISAPANAWQSITGNVQGTLNQLSGLVSNGQALGYKVANIDQAFATRYSGYRQFTPGNYSTQANQWIRGNLDSISGALRVAGYQSDQFATETQALRSIQNLASTAPGALQAAQAGVMVAGKQVEQLQMLRQLMMAQMSAQNDYLATKLQKDADNQAAADQHFRPYVPTAPSFRSSGGKDW